jgi:hypothetical protein
VAAESPISNVYQGSNKSAGSFITDYMKTSGFKEINVSEFSAQDEAEFKMQIKDAFVQNLKNKGYDLSHVVFLSPTTNQFKVTLVKAKSKDSGFLGFGSGDSKIEKKYRIDYDINCDFLYVDANPPENLNRVTENVKISLATYGGAQKVEVASIEGNYDNLKSLSAYNFYSAANSSDELHIDKLNLTKQQKLEISEQAHKSFNKTNIDVNKEKFYISLEYTSPGLKPKTIIVDTTQNPQSDLLGTLNIDRNFKKTPGSCQAFIASFFK